MERLKVSMIGDENSRIGEDSVGTAFKRDGEKTLSLTFEANLDYYLTLINFDDDPTFVIGKDNYPIYAAFLKLYQNIMNGNIYPIDESEIDRIVFMAELYEEDYHEELKRYIKRHEEDKQFLLKEARRKGLIQGNKIVWKSDDYCSEDVSPYFMIEKLENAFVLKFFWWNCFKKKENSVRDHSVRSVRIRMSGSYYDPFNICFAELFKDLESLDFDYLQMDIEEAKIQERVDNKECLERILLKK